MFVLKAIRHAAFDVLDQVPIQIDIGGMLSDVTTLRNPPSGGWASDSDLPAIYAFMNTETITPQSFKGDDRKPVFEFVLQARGTSENVLDQLDDMQLELEIRFANSNGFSGLVQKIRPTGSRAHTERGSVVFAARIVSFEVSTTVERRNPTLT